MIFSKTKYLVAKERLEGAGPTGFPGEQPVVVRVVIRVVVRVVIFTSG